MRRLLTLVYRGDSKPKRTLRLLNIFQATGHLLVSLPPVLVFGKFEGYFEEEPIKEERFMTDNDIIGISNDMARDISYYDVFDLNSMNTGVIRPSITMTRFEFKSMMFQMLKAIGQYSGVVNEDPHLHLRHFLELASNFKITRIINDDFRLKLFSYSLMDRAKHWLDSLEPISIAT